MLHPNVSRTFPGHIDRGEKPAYDVNTRASPVAVLLWVGPGEMLRLRILSPYRRSAHLLMYWSKLVSLSSLPDE